MRTQILYIIVFLLILVIFFIDKKEDIPFTPLTGQVLSIETTDQRATTLDHRETSGIRLVDQKDTHIDHAVKKDTKPDTRYQIRDTIPSAIIKTVQKAIKAVKSVPSIPSVSSEKSEQKAQKLKTIKKDTPIQTKSVKKPDSISRATTTLPHDHKTTDEASYKSLLDIIDASTKNYYFTNNHKTLRFVTVTVFSSTPHKDKNILKILVKNSQKDYFFISGLEIREGKKKIEAKTHYEPLVAPDKTDEFLVLLPRSSSKTYKLKLIESGGKKRIYDISFKTP